MKKNHIIIDQIFLIFLILKGVYWYMHKGSPPTHGLEYILESTVFYTLFLLYTYRYIHLLKMKVKDNLYYHPLWILYLLVFLDKVYHVF